MEWLRDSSVIAASRRSFVAVGTDSQMNITSIGSVVLFAIKTLHLITYLMVMAAPATMPQALLVVSIHSSDLGMRGTAILKFIQLRVLVPSIAITVFLVFSNIRLISDFFDAGRIKIPCHLFIGKQQPCPIGIAASVRQAEKACCCFQMLSELVNKFPELTLCLLPLTAIPAKYPKSVNSGLSAG